MATRYLQLLPFFVVSLYCTQITSADSPQNEKLANIWKAECKVDNSILPEGSGIVASRQYSGVFWAHGDSGTEPKLVAFDRTGKIIAEVTVSGAPNTDWEDICADDQGNLYIGDIGNNTKLFPVRYVYQISEPDPASPPKKAIPVKKRWRYKFPDKKRLDCESLFWHAGELFVIPRSSDSTIYRIVEDEKGNGNSILEPVQKLNATHLSGAEVSPDGTQLVVCSGFGAWLYPISKSKDLVDTSKAKKVFYPPSGSIEACCFDGSDVRLLAERGWLFKITSRQFEDQVRFSKP